MAERNLNKHNIIISKGKKYAETGIPSQLAYI